MDAMGKDSHQTLPCRGELLVLGRVRQEHQRFLVESTWICFIYFYGTDDGISGGDVRTCHLHFSLLKHYCDVQLHALFSSLLASVCPLQVPLCVLLRHHPVVCSIFVCDV